ncbi:hypothetical protein [Kribbella hippodromi]
MGDQFAIGRGLRWKWFLDDVRQHARLLSRLYLSRMYSWGPR